jgi:hypothetical protein
MRFTVFHAASISPARLLLAAWPPLKRAVQAEKDRYPLFPELVRYAPQKAAWPNCADSN